MSLAMPTSHRPFEASPTTRNSPTQVIPPDDPPSPFSRDELHEFSADDASAGRNIAKILTALFIYTLVAMSVATWWTLRTLGD